MALNSGSLSGSNHVYLVTPESLDFQIHAACKDLVASHLQVRLARYTDASPNFYCSVRLFVAAVEMLLAPVATAVSCYVQACAALLHELRRDQQPHCKHR
jgi:hypothetical protein